MTKHSFTPQQCVALLKHLAGGKSLDDVAAILHTSRDTVVAFARTHGYPDNDKMLWAADVLADKAANEASAIPARTERIPTPQPAPAAVPNPAALAAKPDEIRVLLNTAKAHPAKRIQAAADKVFDQLDHIRALLREDEAKHAERRKAEAARQAARDEIARLERELREAKAKLRGGLTPESSAPTPPAGVDWKTIRAWARDQGIDCPATGRVPNRVLDQYTAAHTNTAA